jgi:hypothetical protein
MELSDEQISRIWDAHTVPVFGKTGINPIVFARAIESEVRKDDEALIRQLVDALEQSQPYVESCANGKRVQWWGAQLDRAQDAINAARARMSPPPTA